MKYIIALILCAVAILSFYKIKKGSGLCTKDVNDSDLRIGTVLLVALLTALNALNFIFSSQALFPFVIWGAFMVLLICTAVFYYQSCRNVELIMNLLNKAGSYKDISDALFTGFVHFETTMPPRGFSEEKRIYLKGFKDFAHALLEQNAALTEEEFSELLALQKILRKKDLCSTLLLGMVSAWFLTLPTVIILALMKLM